jgi:hypothetical protein
MARHTECAYYLAACFLVVDTREVGENCLKFDRRPLVARKIDWRLAGAWRGGTCDAFCTCILAPCSMRTSRSLVRDSDILMRHIIATRTGSDRPKTGYHCWKYARAGG